MYLFSFFGKFFKIWGFLLYNKIFKFDWFLCSLFVNLMLFKFVLMIFICVFLGNLLILWYVLCDLDNVWMLCVYVLVLGILWYLFLYFRLMISLL